MVVFKKPTENDVPVEDHKDESPDDNGIWEERSPVVIAENLDDDKLYDPISDTLIDLDQATSGKWPAPKYGVVSEEHIEKYYAGEEKELVRIMNYLKSSKEYKRFGIPSDLHKVLHQLKMLVPSQWRHHSLSFVNKQNRGIIMFPQIHWTASPETCILLIIPIDNVDGHYLFRRKSVVEKILDLIQPDDSINLHGFECYTFVESPRPYVLEQILEPFKEDDQVEIEVLRDFLIIRSVKPATVELFHQLESYQRIFHRLE